MSRDFILPCNRPQITTPLNCCLFGAAKRFLLHPSSPTFSINVASFRHFWSSKNHIFFYYYLHYKSNLLLSWYCCTLREPQSIEIGDKFSAEVYKLSDPLTHGMLITHTHGISNPLPMVFSPPYPWYIEPLIHSILNPLPMVFWPLYICYIGLSNRGILIPIHMVFWPPTNGISISLSG
jgi:hypothetical protein